MACFKIPTQRMTEVTGKDQDRWHPTRVVRFCHFSTSTWYWAEQSWRLFFVVFFGILRQIL